jgi:hypothetical protein
MDSKSSLRRHKSPSLGYISILMTSSSASLYVYFDITFPSTYFWISLVLPTCSPTYLPVYLHTYLLTYPSTCPHTYLPTYLTTQPATNTPTHVLTRLPIYPPHPLTYLPRHPYFGEVRTNDPIVRAGEDISCLGQRGHCDRPRSLYSQLIIPQMRATCEGLLTPFIWSPYV